MVPSAQDASEVVPWLTSAATIVALQRWLKTKKLYWDLVRVVPGADKWAHWCIAGAASLIAAAGIHLTWNWDMIHGGQFAGSLPSLMDLVHGLGDWFKVYILQWTIYESHNKSDPGPAVDPGPVLVDSKGVKI